MSDRNTDATRAVTAPAAASDPVAAITTSSRRKLPWLVRWRRLWQVLSLLVLGQWSFYGIFRCPFIVPYVSCQNCPVITCHGRLVTMFWGFWLLLPLSLLLFGRAFCGWFCPGGLVVQLLGRLAPLQLRVRHGLIRWFSLGKYVALAAALGVWLGWGQPRLATPIRVGPFLDAVTLTLEHANGLWLARTAIVLGLIVLGLGAAGLWCRFFCPAGGALEALKFLSWFKVHKTDRCNDCDRCRLVCEMGTRPAETNCTNCGACLASCPTDAIRVGHPAKKTSSFEV